MTRALRRGAVIATVTISASLGLIACGQSTRSTSATATGPAPAAANENKSQTQSHPGGASENENNSQSHRRQGENDSQTHSQAAPSRHRDAGRAGQAPYAVGERTVVFVDPSRRVRFPGRRAQPRRLVTVIRYPTAGPQTERDLVNAKPLRTAGPFPLIVFGHGFAVTPRPYSQLLRAWAGAGYVVAAPVFPLENANAPGGPNESDLINQPRDMRFVTTEMLAASADRHDPLAGLVDPGQIAVTGQSDGGETALAVAYDRYYLDRRVRAAIILSGAVIPGAAGFTFPAPSPPLLAVQGTADTINQPRFTNAFFALAQRPKFLLRLLGAGHLPPYTSEQPQLSIVESVTIAFLDRFLKHRPGAAGRMATAGQVPGLAQLIARP